MIRFEHIEYLWLLAGVALLGAGIALTAWHRRRRMKRWADEPMLPRLVPDRRTWRPVTKATLLLLGISFLIVALANPQKGTKMEKGKRTGSDIAICLDVSNSMMAEDLKPNRLARSKQVVNSLLNTMTGDRVSLVVFAGTSFIEMPLTNDYNAAKLFLDQVDCSMIATQGTAIGDAIEKAMESFGYGDENREWSTNGSRAIIVISDGENHEDDARSAAKKAAKEGIRVCSIGMGTTNPTPIPSQPNGSYRRDRNGNVIITRLNEQMLRDIANAGKGVYVHGGSNMSEISNLLETLEKNDFGEAIFGSFESRYQYPLLAGLLCLLAELFIFERRNKRWRLFAALLLLGLPCTISQAQTSLSQLHQGNSLYRQGKYLEAANLYSHLANDTTLEDQQRAKVFYNLGNCFLKLGREGDDNQTLETATKCYSQAITLNPQSSKANSQFSFKLGYNLANTLYQQKKYIEAADQYNIALGSEGLTDNQRIRTMYNLGNSFLKQAQQTRDTATLRTAIECYRNALRLEPTNADYRYNQTLAYRLMDKWTRRNRQKQKQQDKQRQQQQDKQQNKDQQQQQKKDQQKKEQQQQQKQQQQSEKQKKEQKKKEDSKQLNDKVNQELNRQKQKQNRQKQKQNKQQQQQDKQQQNQQQQNQQQQNKQQQNQQQQNKQQNQQQDQQQQQKQQQQGNQQQKQGDKGQEKQNQQQLNDEIKKELERQKQKEKEGKDSKKEKQKNQSSPKDQQNTQKGKKAEQQQQQHQQQQQSSTQENHQQPNAQQGTVITGKRIPPDKKNAENLLQAVRNNERGTLKKQIIKAQPGKTHHIDKEW